jgi:hypothetical protein
MEFGLVAAATMKPANSRQVRSCHPSSRILSYDVVQKVGQCPSSAPHKNRISSWGETDDGMGWSLTGLTESGV